MLVTPKFTGVDKVPGSGMHFLQFSGSLLSVKKTYIERKGRATGTGKYFCNRDFEYRSV